MKNCWDRDISIYIYVRVLVNGPHWRLQIPEWKGHYADVEILNLVEDWRLRQKVQNSNGC